MAPSSHHKIKLWLHTCAFILMVGALGVALVITMNPVFIGGANRTPMAARVGMSMAGKGLLFLSYQILTENVRFCKRIASTKANMILNCIETVAWPAACGVTVYGIMQFCIGISCTLSWVMVPLTVVLAIISGFSAWISIKEHKNFKRTGIKPGDMKLETMNSEDSNKAFNAGNGASIHQGAGKAPELLRQSVGGAPAPSQQHYGGRAPSNQHHQQHYTAPAQHNQQHYQQQQHYAASAQHNQQNYQQQQQYGGSRR